MDVYIHATSIMNLIVIRQHVVSEKEEEANPPNVGPSAGFGLGTPRLLLSNAVVERCCRTLLPNAVAFRTIIHSNAILRRTPDYSSRFPYSFHSVVTTHASNLAASRRLLL